MKKIILGLLSVNVVLNIFANTVSAQTEEDWGSPAQDTDQDWRDDPLLYPDTPDEEPDTEWDLPTTPAPTTPTPTTPAPTTPAPATPAPTYEDSEASDYEEPVTEAPVTETEATTSETTTTEESDVEDSQAIKDLVGDALANPAYTMALTDYLHVAGEDYVYTNPLDESIIGSSMEDVQSQFEAYLADKEMPDNPQAEISKNAESEDLDEVQLLQYHYYYAGEPHGKETQVATLKFFFKEDQLFASSVHNHVPILTSEVSQETMDMINHGEMTYESLIEAAPVISGFVHKYVDGVETGVAVMAGQSDDQINLHFLNLSQEIVELLEQKTTEEKIAADQLMDSFVTGKEPQPQEEAENTSLDTDKASPDKQAIEKDADTTETSEASSEAEEDQDQVMVNQVPVGFDYDAEKTVAIDQAEKGFESLKQAAEVKESVSLEDIQEWFGEATVQEDGSYKYVAESADKVIVAYVEFETESQEVISIKIDQRTPQLFEKFGLTVDDLYPIYEKKETMVDQLFEKLGEVTIFEYMPQDLSLRYLWTSFEDEEIQNIEVTKDLDTGDAELLYYEP